MAQSLAHLKDKNIMSPLNKKGSSNSIRQLNTSVNWQQSSQLRKSQMTGSPSIRPLKTTRVAVPV